MIEEGNFMMPKEIEAKIEEWKVRKDRAAKTGQAGMENIAAQKIALYQAMLAKSNSPSISIT